MTVLYGTVEYFERQLSDYLVRSQRDKFDLDISNIYSKLENEIIYDNFLSDEKIRVQFLNNLTNAVDQVIDRRIGGIFNEKNKNWNFR